MLRLALSYLLLFGAISLNAQVEITGETYLGTKKITDVVFNIKTGGVTIHTFQAVGKSNYTVEVEHGKVYEVHLKYPGAYDMFFEIKADNVPARKYDDMMEHLCDIVFYSTKDDTIDPKAFSIPFYRVIYDGKVHFVEDPNQSCLFEKIVYRKPEEMPKKAPPPDTIKKVISNNFISGKVYTDFQGGKTYNDKLVKAFDKNGKEIGSARTNKYGTFVFQNISPSDIQSMEIEIDDPNLITNKFCIANSKNVPIYNTKISSSGKYIWQMDVKQIESLMDNISVLDEDSLMMRIGRKGVMAGRIFVNTLTGKTYNNKIVKVYDKNGKLLGTAYTNRFGEFVFQNIVPGHIYRMETEVDDADLEMTNFSIYNDKNQAISVGKPESKKCSWHLNARQLENLVDNNYTSNIGGKLVVFSYKEKKFFAEKMVYLADKNGNMLKKVKTNPTGSFAFEEIKPNQSYVLEVDKIDVSPGEKIDLLTKEDKYVATLDSNANSKKAMGFNSTYNKKFNEISINDQELKMDVKAKIYGDNIEHPIGKLKVLLLNDTYQVIDSAVTDNFGAFKFKYLPFLKRFYLTAENTDNILDVFKNILIYSSDANLIKIMTHQKGTKFLYKSVSAEVTSLRDIELDDPWLDYVGKKSDGKEIKETKEVKEIKVEKRVAKVPKPIIENILFEYDKSELTSNAKEVLDKIILVLNSDKAMRIEVGAHTDSKGTTEHNQTLSERRALAVKNYISKSGIDGKRIITKGYGESKILNRCIDGVECSEQEHAMNRRIEFKILED